MSEAVAENNVEIRERFEVDNDMKAEWCLNKIRKVREQQNRETEELMRQMQFYKDQIEMIAARADEDVEFFEGMLRGYFNDRVEAGFTKATKTKVSYKLPTGEMALKHLEPVYKRDDKAVMEWLRKEHAGDHIKVKEELDWAGLKKEVQVSGNGCVVPSTGEIVPGIEVIEREDEFVVEVK